MFLSLIHTEEIVLKWEKIESEFPGEGMTEVFRAPVPGGWLVMLSLYAGDGGTSVTFYPDTSHSWDGSSLHRT